MFLGVVKEPSAKQVQCCCTTGALDDALSASCCVCKFSRFAHDLQACVYEKQFTKQNAKVCIPCVEGNWDLQVTYQADPLDNRTVVFTVDAGSNIQPWSAEAPNMYSAIITLTTSQSDQVVVPFGFHKVQAQSLVAAKGVVPCLP